MFYRYKKNQYTEKLQIHLSQIPKFKGLSLPRGSHLNPTTAEFLRYIFMPPFKMRLSIKRHEYFEHNNSEDFKIQIELLIYNK